MPKRSLESQSCSMEKTSKKTALSNTLYSKNDPWLQSGKIDYFATATVGQTGRSGTEA